jgi:hypothetical protein
MDDEWLFTPIPRAMQRSNASLLESPSSRASSYTLIFFGNLLPNPFESLVAASNYGSQIRLKAERTILPQMVRGS